MRYFVVLLTTAFGVGSAYSSAAQQPVTSDAAMANERARFGFMHPRCEPTQESADIVVCAHDNERYRIPLTLRGHGFDPGDLSTPSVSRERRQLLDNNSGRGIGCSGAVGPAGSVGCNLKSLIQHMEQDTRGGIHF